MIKISAAFAGAVLGLAFNLHAAPVLLAPQPAPPDSIVQITADAQGLIRVPPEQVPASGTFWVVEPRGGLLPVPLPCPPVDSSWPVFAIADGQFLADGTVGGGINQLTETALLVQADAVVNLILQVQTSEANRQARRMARAMGVNGLSLGGEDGEDDDGFLPAGQPSPIDTNRLWLEIITMTNQTASLVIHPPSGVSNQVYELLYATNLLVPPTNWQWVLRSYPGQTNLIVPNAKDAQGFYRLAAASDPMANSSLGTNFWLAFYSMYSYDGNNLLSLFISSPVGATGTVTIPSILTNGDSVVVTNCGDAALDGTYQLTSLTTQEQLDWMNYGIPAASPSYVHGTNWIVVNDAANSCFLIAYDSGDGGIVKLYSKAYENLNGSTNDWTREADTNSPPETVCQQVPWSHSFALAAGTGTNIAIVSAIMLDAVGPNDLIETNGIHVTASHPVSVYALDYDQFVTTAYTGYPTRLLGTNYCLMARPAWADTAESQLAILATESNTTVWITPSTNASLVNHDQADSYTIVLEQGMVYENRSLYPDSDVTGTWIRSDKPIAVFAGANQAFVPDGNTRSGNPLVQEQMPVESWGKEVLAMSLAGRTNGDTYRILAAYSNTVITITGKVVTVVDSNAGVGPWSVTTSNGVVSHTITNAGQFYDIILDGPVEFQASQPVQVAQFANGVLSDHAYDNPFLGEGDPCEILLPPVGHYLQTNIVLTLTNGYQTGDFDENYLNVIVVQSAITNTLVDGRPIGATNFVAIGTSGYFGAKITVTNSGVHKVTSPAPVGVQVYGWGIADAYGYIGGVVK